MDSGILKIAYEKIKEMDGSLEDGDKFVFQCDNAIIIIWLEDKTLKHVFIGGQPIRIEGRCDLYE